MEVTSNDVVPLAAFTLCEAGLTNKIGAAPACSTVTTTGVTPAAETVMFAVRGRVERFWLMLAVIVPFPVPACVTTHQAASLSAIHEVFEVTSKLVLPKAAETF